MTIPDDPPTSPRRGADTERDAPPFPTHSNGDDAPGRDRADPDRPDGNGRDGGFRDWAAI